MGKCVLCVREKENKFGESVTFKGGRSIENPILYKNNVVTLL